MQTSPQTALWHTLSAADSVARLGVDPRRGLDAAEVERRRAEHGANAIPPPPRRGPLHMLLGQFTDLMILVLLGAGLIAGLVGEPQDALAIFAIVVLNALVGFVQEYRAERAVQALRDLAAPLARVRRAGAIADIPARELVPGDVVLLEAGQIVPADLRLIEVSRLAMEEAALTGESAAALKSIDALADPDLALGDRRNLAFKGTHVAQGRGVGVVVATGLHTELGAIARLMTEQKPVLTPLQKRLALFGRRIAWVVLLVCAVIFAAGLLRGEPPLLMFMTAVSLAVAAIPEALPAVVTIGLALGARRMVRGNALVRRLSAVETLGSVTFICTDKTGTLTENRMRVVRLWIDGELCAAADAPQSATWKLLGPALALSNDVESDPAGGVVGDPTEVALLEAAAGRGCDKSRLAAAHPRIDEAPFSSERKRMTTLHRWTADPHGAVVAFCKGAPEVLLPRCRAVLIEGREAPLEKREIAEAAAALAAAGIRVLAVAARIMEMQPADAEEGENDLVLLALLGLEDPPRAEVSAAVADCFGAGIRPVMITGDHPATAAAIAARLGIATPGGSTLSGRELADLTPEALEPAVLETRVYARVSPAQKLAIVEALQRRGQFVAMTGDGVNDAPAIRRADIGIAMGRTGTDVAREASDLVLLDDNFATIVQAVHEGRRIYANIRKFIRFAMAGNLAEVLTLFLAPFLGLPLPLLPIHILWINLVTDGLPGLALAAEPAERGVMKEPPTPPGESIFARGMWQHIVWVGALMAALAVLLEAWELSANAASWQTMVFTVLTFAQMAHVLAIRAGSDSLFDRSVPPNRALNAAVTLTLALQLAVIYVPLLNPLFHTVPLAASELALCATAALVVLLAVEFEKWLVRRGRV